MARARTTRTQVAPITTRQMARLLVFSSGLALVLSILLSVNLLPRAYEFQQGDVSQTNVRSPRQVTYPSQVRTRAERERAAAAVQPVVDIDPSIVQRQRAALSGLLQGISAARNAPGLTPDEREAQLQRLGQPPLQQPNVGWLAMLEDARWYSVSSESQRLLWDALKESVPEPRVSEIVRALPVRVSDQLNDVERALAVDLASRFVSANVVQNPEATARLRREAEEAVAPVQVTVEKGETVVREGQVLTAADLEKLEMLGLRQPSVDWRQVATGTLLSFVAAAMLAGYLLTFQPALIGRDRTMALLALLVVVTVLAAKFVIPARPLWVYIFPLPAVGMLVATLLDGRLAILLSGVLAMLVAYAAGGSFEVAAMGLATGTVAALSVWRRERLHSYFVAGMLVALTQTAVVMAFQVGQRADDLQFLATLAFECAFNGFLSAALALGTVSLLGRIFGITTTMQLLELANPTQPLLRRLLMEAPGTYHHSIMVGNLAERAAEEVGADPLLARVGAYYHDIGKLRRPYFFVENQAGGENVHETLDPEVSAEIVRAHVSDGVQLCEQFGVPTLVRQLIPEHHGTRLVSFFFDQAQDAATASGRPPPDPAAFSYSGPRPRSKEGAILMLADSVEAAARASKDHSTEAITALVDRLIMQRVAEGQLDECDLTLRDIQRIKDAFRAILVGMYHPRIEYPERRRNALPPAPAVELTAGVGDAAR